MSPSWSILVHLLQFSEQEYVAGMFFFEWEVVSQFLATKTHDKLWWQQAMLQVVLLFERIAWVLSVAVRETFSKQNAAFLVCKALGEPKSIRKWHLSQVSYYQSENATRFPRPNVSIAFSISQKVKINISSGPLRPCYPEAVATSRLPGFMQKLVRNTWSHAAWSHWKKICGKNVEQTWTNCKSKPRDQARLGSSQRNAQTLCFSNEHTLLLRQDAGGSMKCLE